MQQLELLTSGDDEGLSFFAEAENAAIVGPRRGREGSGVLVEAGAVGNGSRRGVDPAEESPVSVST
jgi:hypothetical protein